MGKIKVKGVLLQQHKNSWNFSTFYPFMTVLRYRGGEYKLFWTVRKISVQL